MSTRARHVWCVPSDRFGRRTLRSNIRDMGVLPSADVGQLLSRCYGRQGHEAGLPVTPPLPFCGHGTRLVGLRSTSRPQPVGACDRAERTQNFDLCSSDFQIRIFEWGARRFGDHWDLASDCQQARAHRSMSSPSSVIKGLSACGPLGLVFVGEITTPLKSG